MEGQPLFLYLWLQAVFGVPLMEPGIFTLSPVAQSFDTIRIVKANVLAAPQFTAGEVSHYLSY